MNKRQIEERLQELDEKFELTSKEKAEYDDLETELSRLNEVHETLY